MSQTTEEIPGKTSHKEDEHSVFLLLPGWIIPGLKQPPYSRRVVRRDGVTFIVIFVYQFGKQFVLSAIPVDFNLGLGREMKGDSCPPSPFSERVACGLQYCVSNMITYTTVT